MELTCALGPDSAGTLLTDALSRASRSIEAALYEVGPAYRWLFVEAAERGVAVRVILDAHRSDGNAGTLRALERAGARCRVLGAGRRAAHWKLVLVDRRRLWVGTGNLIWRDAPRDRAGRLPPAAAPLSGTREWWSMVSGVSARHSALRAFERAWRVSSSAPASWMAGAAIAPEAAVGSPMPQVPPLALRACPRRVRFLSGAGDVRAALMHLAGSADRRLFLTVPYVHPRVAAVSSLLDACCQARARGLDVRLLLGERPEARDREALLRRELDCRVMDPARCTRGHAKGAVTEGAVLVMSANLSAGGLTANWEAAILARHERAAAYYADAFLRDWSVSTPLAADILDPRCRKSPSP